MALKRPAAAIAAETAGKLQDGNATMSIIELQAKMPKKAPKKAKITALATGEPCVTHVEEFQSWSPTPLRIKSESFRRQVKEWSLAEDVNGAKSLPVKLWFTDAQQRQLWNQMKTSMGKTEEGKEVDKKMSSNDEKNMNLKCFLCLEDVHWQDYLVVTRETHVKSHKKI